jgi:hypothetical protein
MHEAGQQAWRAEKRTNPIIAMAAKWKEMHGRLSEDAQPHLHS